MERVSSRMMVVFQLALVVREMAARLEAMF
jgi:hypothetical protein